MVVMVGCIGGRARVMVVMVGCIGEDYNKWFSMNIESHREACIARRKKVSL